jgi:hypothetical protein
MIKGKSFLQRLDESTFDEQIVAISNKVTTDTHIDDIRVVVEELKTVPDYKKQSLVEYIDKNRDKLLSLSTYTEGDPVQVSDDFAPHASKHGKVISKGAVVGSYKVKFEDGEYDVPEHHLTRKDSIATESHTIDAAPVEVVEHKCIAVTHSGKFLKIILESIDGSDELIEEQLGESVYVVFPESITESFVNNVSESMTDEQQKKREEIVLAMKNNESELKKRYGDKWESVMYAIATKKAMGESLEEATQDVIFKHTTSNGTIKIVKRGEYFDVEQLDSHGSMVDSHMYSSAKEAEAAVQDLM